MLRTECQTGGMSNIKNGALDQYGAEHFEQQQYGQLVLKGLIIQKQTMRRSMTEWPF